MSSSGPSKKSTLKFNILEGTRVSSRERKLRTHKSAGGICTFLNICFSRALIFMVGDTSFFFFLNRCSLASCRLSFISEDRPPAVHFVGLLRSPWQQCRDSMAQSNPDGDVPFFFSPPDTSTKHVTCISLIPLQIVTRKRGVLVNVNAFMAR